MNSDDGRAINAVWKSDGLSANEKMVLYHLASKHELGEKFSSSWKHILEFLEDFEDKWCSMKELGQSTQLGEIKLGRALTELHGKDLVKFDLRPAKTGKKKQLEGGQSMERIVAITEKLFVDYRNRVNPSAPAMAQSA